MIKQTLEQRAYEKSPSEKTASTIWDLASFNTPNSARMLAEIEKRNGKMSSIAPDLSFLVASRHLTTRRLLDSLSPNYQIVEMGAGFSPHGVNYASKFDNYLEIDLPYNSFEKKEVVSNLNGISDSVTYIPGDLFDTQTWRQVNERLDQTKPLFIFCEGVVSHYASEEQKDILGKILQGTLVHPESKLYLDDTLKNHPELDTNPIVISGRKALATSLKNTSYPGITVRNFESEMSNWKERGFDIGLVPYANVGATYSTVTDSLRGMLCTKRRTVK